MLVFTLHMIITWWWELGQIRDCEMYIKNHSATKEHVAFNALLNATYDVVVKHDVHMKIEEGGDKLACLLLHQSGTHLDNIDFRRLTVYTVCTVCTVCTVQYVLYSVYSMYSM